MNGSHRLACWSAAGLTALMLCACMSRAAGYQEAAAANPPPPAADPQEPFKEEVRGLLRREQFERLDRLSDELIKTKARFSGGDWKSHRFQEALGKPRRAKRRPTTRGNGRSLCSNAGTPRVPIRWPPCSRSPTR